MASKRADVDYDSLDLNLDFDLGKPDDFIGYAAQALAREERLSFPDWADQNFRLVEESSGIPGPWSTLQYQRSIMNCFANDDIRYIAFQKCARVGYTKMLTGFNFYSAAYLKRNVINYNPVKDDAVRYDKDELQPAIEQCPSILKNLKVDSAYKKDTFNTWNRKAFLGAVLHNLGGTSGNVYRGITADNVHQDEIDAYNKDIKGKGGNTEGSPIALAARAITDSPFKKQIVGSTPTEDGISIIQSEIKKLEDLKVSKIGLVFRRDMPCPCCGEFQVLDWGTDKPFGIKFTDDDASTTVYKCRHCEDSFDYSQLRGMDAKGRWTSKKDDNDNLYYVIDDHTGDFYFNTDLETKVKPPKRIGFMISTLYSYFMTWNEMVEEFIAAMAGARSGDIEFLKTFINHRLGEVWEDKESEKIDAKEFASERVCPDWYFVNNMEYEVPQQAVAIVESVDIQGDMWVKDTVAYGPDEESWGVRTERRIGQPSADSFWQSLSDSILSEYTSPSGMMQTDICVIDSGWGEYTQRVYDLCREKDFRRCIPVKGSPPGRKYELAPFPHRRNKKGVFFMSVGVDASSQVVMDRAKINPEKVEGVVQLDVSTPGACWWPQGRGYDEQYFQEMLAPNKKFVMQNHKKMWTWVTPDGVNDEIHDCRKYAVAGVRALQTHMFGVDLNVHRSLITNTKKTIAEMAKELNS